jgi:hypothetical protein
MPSSSFKILAKVVKAEPYTSQRSGKDFIRVEFISADHIRLRTYWYIPVEDSDSVLARVGARKMAQLAQAGNKVKVLELDDLFGIECLLLYRLELAPDHGYGPYMTILEVQPRTIVEYLPAPREPSAWEKVKNWWQG